MKATGETGLTEDMADDGAVVPQVAVSLTVEHLAQITEAVRSSLQSQISTLVSSIVDGVVKGLQSKISSLEEETQQLRSKLRSLVEKADKSEQYSRRNCLRLSGIPETADESVDIISCTVRWQGTWRLVHGRRRSGDMIRHSREQVSKSPAT